MDTPWKPLGSPRGAVTFISFGIPKESRAEYRSWENSLPKIGMIISNRKIADEVQVALEYQIPLTSKRVDFMIGGTDGVHNNIVIVELKQWETCRATSRENVVKAFTGGAERDVAHPSQQAYSYAKLISNFNEAVRENDIGLIPCAYLHNTKKRTGGRYAMSDIRRQYPMLPSSCRKMVKCFRIS